MENTNQTKSNVNFILLAVLAFLIFLLFTKGCKAEKTEPVTISVPEQSGKFNQVKPVQKPVAPIGQKVSNKNKSKSDKSNNEILQKKIDLLLQENKRLQSAYENANDSLQLALYNKAIEVKSFKQDYENENIFISANGLVRGEVQSLGFDYKIKERKVEVKPQKQTFLRVLAGAEIGNSKSLDQFSVKGNLFFQNRKGNILSTAVDTDQRFYIGYNFSILNLKR